MLRSPLLKFVSFAAFLPLTFAAACGDETGASAPVGTWGVECTVDEDCEGLSCLCGVCTQTCLTDVDCEDLGASASADLVCAPNGTDVACEGDGPVCITSEMMGGEEPEPEPEPETPEPEPEPETPEPANGGNGGGATVPVPVGMGGEDGVGGEDGMGGTDPDGGAGGSGTGGMSNGGAMNAGGDTSGGGTDPGVGGGLPIDVDAGAPDAGVEDAGGPGPDADAAVDEDGGFVDVDAGAPLGGFGGQSADAGVLDSGLGGAGGAGGSGGMNPCTELGAGDELVTNFDDWDTNTDPADWAFDWAGNETELSFDEGFSDAEFTFEEEDADDYALRGQAGPTEQGGGALEIMLSDGEACIDATAFDGIRLVVRSESTEDSELEVELAIDAPPGSQPDPLTFDVGTDIDDEVVLQIPFTDFDAAFEPSSLVGITIRLTKDNGGEYELIVDDIEFY
jgi:hypothetical protein